MTEEFEDLIIFYDEDGTKKEIYAKLISTENLVRFKTKGGNIISIPTSSVVKIKQREEHDAE